MTDNAIVLTGGLLATSDVKTAHGLIRGSSRFTIMAVIDAVHAGQDAGLVMDGKACNIPVYGSIDNFLEQSSSKCRYCIVGVALPGGVLPAEMKQTLLEAMQKGMSVVNGGHHPLGEEPAFKAAAQKYGVKILDIRQTRSPGDYHFWNGEIMKVKTPRIVVLGTDCAIGKRTTCRFILEMCRSNNIRAEMIYTGQTGWMQGYTHGFLFDTVPNDFVCGEIEHAVVSCDQELHPELILIEGQAALRHPAGPCGSEFLVSGQAKGVILQHVPFRKLFCDYEALGFKIPSIEDEIALIGMYGSRVLAVTLNGEGGTDKDLIAVQRELEQRLNIPVVRPLEEGVRALLPVVRAYMNEFDNDSPDTG